ncbi:hypothetical protein TNCV_1353741 [Trichonephila clavipes]|nr:hypothetical protein TNCV_1353741 [Trichonephila clavipes]
MPSTGRPLSNDTFPDLMQPLAPEELTSASSSGQIHKQAFAGFNKMDNVVSLINSEARGKMTRSSSFPVFRIVNLPQTICLKILFFIAMMEGD